MRRRAVRPRRRRPRHRRDADRVRRAADRLARWLAPPRPLEPRDLDRPRPDRRDPDHRPRGRPEHTGALDGALEGEGRAGRAHVALRGGAVGPGVHAAGVQTGPEMGCRRRAVDRPDPVHRAARATGELRRIEPVVGRRIPAPGPRFGRACRHRQRVRPAGGHADPAAVAHPDRCRSQRRRQPPAVRLDRRRRPVPRPGQPDPARRAVERRPARPASGCAIRAASGSRSSPTRRAATSPTRP